MGAGRHDDANWALIKQLKQKRASKVFTYEMKYKAGRSDGSVIIRSRGWADSPVHKPDTPFSSTLARLLSRPLSALFVDLCLHCLDARPARAVLLFFFFFYSVVLFWQLTCCWPLLCLDDQVHSTFLLTRRPSPECRVGSRTVALQRRRWSRNVHYVQVAQCSPVWAALPYLS